MSQLLFVVFMSITHAHTPIIATESTNERVAYWSMAELCLLVLVSVWQIWMLKRSFEVVRSV